MIGVADYGEVQQTNDGAELHQHQIAPSDYTCIGEWNCV